VTDNGKIVRGYLDGEIGLIGELTAARITMCDTTDKAGRGFSRASSSLGQYISEHLQSRRPCNISLAFGAFTAWPFEPVSVPTSAAPLARNPA